MIAILAILICLISIFSKIIAHFKYLTINPNKDIDIPVAFGAFSPFFISDKDGEKENSQLKSIGNRIKVYLALFYLGLITFFVYVSVSA